MDVCALRLQQTTHASIPRAGPVPCCVGWAPDRTAACQAPSHGPAHRLRTWTAAVAPRCARPPLPASSSRTCRWLAAQSASGIDGISSKVADEFQTARSDCRTQSECHAESGALVGAPYGAVHLGAVRPVLRCHARYGRCILEIVWIAVQPMDTNQLDRNAKPRSAQLDVHSGNVRG